MGRWMCQHVLKHSGHQVIIHSRTAAKCKPLVDLGATMVDSPAAMLSKNPNVIFCMMGYPSELENVVFAPSNGIVPMLKKKALLESDFVPPLFVDMSTSKPDLAERIAKSFEGIGSDALDAPVSGGDIGARERRLAIMVGGSQDAFNRVRPLFECMTTPENITLMGPPGSGQHTKMANQIAIAAGMIAACEFGLDAREMLRVIQGGAAGSWTLSNLAPRILNNDLEPGFYVEHFLKDLRIVLDVCREYDLHLPGTTLAANLYTSLKSAGFGRKGTQALILVLDQLNGELQTHT